MKRKRPKRKQRLEDTVKSGTKLGYAKYRIERFDIAKNSVGAQKINLKKIRLIL